MPTPLFSTYRQGENRVSGSLLAVFERLGIDLVARILGAALEEPELELVTYTPQAGAGGQGVPDGEMRGDFRYLFEVKTEPGQIAGGRARKQLRQHLERLADAYHDERLIVLTPDAGPPVLLEELGDQRVAWMSFDALGQAINALLEDPAEPASEQQRLLLRELVALFELDRLVAGDDVAVVAARRAYPLWQRYGAYVCQANRSFRPVGHWGFYRNKRIEPEFPRVLANYAEVTFTEDTAAQWRASSDDHRAAAGQVMAAMLADDVEEPGSVRDIHLLDRADDSGLTQRPGPLPHTGPGAWTQHQRYANLSQLLAAASTADLG